MTMAKFTLATLHKLIAQPLIRNSFRVATPIYSIRAIRSGTSRAIDGNRAENGDLYRFSSA